VGRGCARRTSQRGALLLIGALCLGPAWSTPGCAVTPTAHSTAALSTAPAGPAPAVEQAGPYAATIDGLVDLDSRIPGGVASGTGIVLSPDGVVVTNNHEVARADAITATDLADGRSYRASVVGRDPGHDIAVSRLVGASGLPVAPLGDSDRLEVGDRVAAIGNAGGRGGRPTITTGAVTALMRSIVAADDATHQRRLLHGMIQVSATVEPGDSGGALVAASGVVGMVSATSPGAGYAIPIDTVLSVAHKLGADEHARSDHGDLPAERSLAVRSGHVAKVASRPHAG